MAFPKGVTGNPNGRPGTRRAARNEIEPTVRALAAIRDDGGQPAAVRLEAANKILAIAFPGEFATAQAAVVEAAWRERAAIAAEGRLIELV